MKAKVLWIEDGALGDLPDLIAPIYVDGSYDLAIALDVTDGIERIMKTKFEAVIVDIRLPPGEDQRWIDIYNAPEKHKNAARMGLLILRSLLKPETSEVKLSSIPKWVSPEVFGVFTVENRNEIAEDLDEFDIKVYRQKTIRPSVTTLLELIKEIMDNAKMPKRG